MAKKKAETNSEATNEHATDIEQIGPGLSKDEFREAVESHHVDMIDDFRRVVFGYDSLEYFSSIVQKLILADADSPEKADTVFAGFTEEINAMAIKTSRHQKLLKDMMATAARGFAKRGIRNVLPGEEIVRVEVEPDPEPPITEPENETEPV